jgi:hypothetical protein
MSKVDQLATSTQIEVRGLATQMASMYLAIMEMKTIIAQMQPVGEPARAGQPPGIPLIPPSMGVPPSTVTRPTSPAFPNGMANSGHRWRKPLMERRGLEHLEKFKGDTQSLFQGQKQHIVGCNSEINFLFEWASEQTHQITDEDLEWSPIMTDAPVEDLGNQIWWILNILLKKEAQVAFNNLPMGNGVEAWRRLNAEHAPNTAVRTQRMLMSLSNPQQVKSMKDLMPAVRKWEDLLMRYEKSGRVYPEDFKVASIIQLCPSSMKEHMIENAGAYSNYAKAREYIRN